MECAESQKRKRKCEEYEMQLFGFHTRAVYATLKNVIMESIQISSKKLCDTLEKRYKLDPENLKMTEEQLVKAYHTASLPHLKSIENIVNRFITIPSNVLLDEDKCQRTQYTETELENIRSKLTDYQQRAKRATILNAALKEELQLIEQFSMCADNADKLSHIIENGVVCPNISDKFHQLIEDYKEFSSSLKDAAPLSQKSLYNKIDNLNCVDYDLNNL